MSINVQGISGHAYRIQVGGHEVVVDQHREDGGEDRGPTPTDLFVAGLASCAAYYAGRFLARHEVDMAEVGATCDYGISTTRPARVEWIAVRLRLPAGLPPDVIAAALRSAEHCAVHNSLAVTPEVTISLKLEAAAA